MIAPGLVDRCSLAPAQALDGRQDGPLVDTRYNVPGYGRLYLSWQTIRDCARLYGMAEQDQFEQAEADRAMLQERVTELETELAEAQPILAAISAAHARYGVEDD